MNARIRRPPAGDPGAAMDDQKAVGADGPEAPPEAARAGPFAGELVAEMFEYDGGRQSRCTSVLTRQRDPVGGRAARRWCGRRSDRAGRIARRCVPARRVPPDGRVGVWTLKHRGVWSAVARPRRSDDCRGSMRCPDGCHRTRRAAGDRPWRSAVRGRPRLRSWKCPADRAMQERNGSPFRTSARPCGPPPYQFNIWSW
ncbi:MAG: hypothetical protein QOK43_3398 [Acidimicrobiaceae bacterium]|nr:hypothetical protein [Acidimicrobiaceae bacterium]